MSYLVERVARAIYEEDDPWHKAWPWPDLQSDQAGVDQYRRIAKAAIAAMQTDAAPALKPAVEVAKETRVSLFGAAAVIEADRAAIIAAKDAEIAALKNAWQKQFDEKMKERDEAKLWYTKAQEWKQSLATLQAHADALAGALNKMDEAYCAYDYGTSEGRAFGRTALIETRKALSAYEEFRRD